MKRGKKIDWESQIPYAIDKDEVEELIKSWLDDWKERDNESWRMSNEQYSLHEIELKKIEGHYKSYLARRLASYEIYKKERGIGLLKDNDAEIIRDILHGKLPVFPEVIVKQNNQALN